MMNPICAKCIYLTSEQEKFRRCPSIPIFHRDMLCSNSENARKDHVDGVAYKPFCEEVNRYGECLVYMPKGLESPKIVFDDLDNIVRIYGTKPFVVTYDDGELNANLPESGIYDEETKVYSEEFSLPHTCKVNAACVEDGVLSETATLFCEIPDTPEIEFDKSTNTVSIKSYNKLYFTTDGSKVTEDSPVYDGPFVIDHNTTVKARSYAREDFSEQVSQLCISIEPPVIEFNSDLNEVSISADDKILYSVDGSDIYDDAAEYDGSFVIEKNTVIKAACIVDDELSEQTELECKVPNIPVIAYDQTTHQVTIESENEVRYTINGEDVKKKDTLYSAPFSITETCTVKAVSVVGDRISEQAEFLCVFVSAPEITFDPDTNTVSITGEDKILYSTDGSKIYDDAEEYTEPFVITKNTTVRAACIKDGSLSDEVTLTCKVPSVPTITFDSKTKTVTIKGENTILYTTDGSDVRKKDAEYKTAFKISVTTTVKARTIVDNRLSEQAELECVI